MATRWCPQCRAGYQSWATECMDCFVPLVDELPAEEPADHSIVVYDVADWPLERRAALDAVLRAEEIVHEWADGELRVGATHEAVVDALVEEFDEPVDLPEPLDVGEPEPEPDDEDAEGLSIASPWRRFTGWLADGLLFTAAFLVIGIVASTPDRRSVAFHAAYSAVVAVYEIVGTARWGQTLGKRFVGIRVVERGTGRPPGWGRAVVRWSLPAVAIVTEGLITGVGGVVGQLVFLVVYLPVAWDPLARGLHDRLAGTVVVDSR